MSKEATAHHEAGHAVIARVLGLRVGVVTIEPTEDLLGSCQFWYRDEPESVRADMLALLAGGFADAKYRGARWDCFEHSAQPTEGEDDDLERFRNRLMEYAAMTGRSASAAEPILFQEAEQLVDQHWPEIQRLARYLTWVGVLEYPAYGQNPRAAFDTKETGR